jgi:hypothetical protein
VPRDYVIKGLVSTSKGLGQTEDAQRYSRMLRQ